MEINDQNLQSLCGALGRTLVSDVKAIREATESLKNFEATPGFTVLLLHLIGQNSVDMQLRLAGSIFFKNCIMQNWVPDEDQKDNIPMNDRATIKKHIVELMLTSPPKIKAQLSHALSIISQADFPKKWDSLLPELVGNLKGQDWNRIAGVLETADSIFHSYRYRVKSEELWQEVKYVLENFQKPLLEVFQQICGLIEQNASNAEVLKPLFKVLLYVCEVFQSLCSQDIPEFIQDTMAQWFNPFKAFLVYKNDLLTPKDEDVPAEVEKVQAVICDIARLFTDKYEEEFKEYVPLYVNDAWNLLTQLNDKGRYDQLVSKAVSFLTSVVTKVWHKDLFSNEQAMRIICEKIVVPQLKLRESDMEVFSMDSGEYVRRDMEGSDIDTRRRTTVDFVRGLCIHFEPQITAILKGYVDGLLKEYAANRANNWVAKDAALYIVLALSVKGKTQTKGVTIVNQYFDVMEFFGTQVLPELQGDIEQNPVLKATCLKFVAVFKNQLPKDAFPVLMPILIKYLASDEYVVHTYAANAIEQILGVKDNHVARVTQNDVSPFVEHTLTGLFKVLDNRESAENEYIMKAIMRLCAVAQSGVTPFAAVILQKITEILSRVSQNPRNPKFNHYLFETISALILHICGSNAGAIGSFEGALFGPFQTMLGMDTCTEFGPYVFQVMAQLLEARSDVSQAYQAIFPSLLAPVLWENHGNIPAIVRLLQAYLEKSAGAVEDSKLTGLLGIFQKLNASKKHDNYGMDLLGTIVETVPMNKLSNYLVEILKLQFARLQTSSTPKFVKHLIVFYCTFICKHGPSALIAAMDKLQPGIFNMVLAKIWLPGTAGIHAEGRKVAIVGMTTLLCQSEEMASGAYTQYWPQLCDAIVSLINLPAASKAGEEEDIMDLSQKSFKTVYAKLVFAPKRTHDPAANVKDPAAFFVQSLGQLTAKIPGKFGGAMSMMSPESANALQQMLQKYNVNIQ